MVSSEQYMCVNLVDVNDLLSFAKKEFKELDKNVKEEERVEKELKHFINIIQQHSGHKIHYMGHEKRYGKHLIRFMLKNGGFLEVIVDKPVTINGHFLSKRSAENFVKGLKDALKIILPESDIKKMIIDSIKIKDSSSEEVLTLDTHNILHKLRIRKTLVMSIVAIQLFLLFEVIQELFEYIAIEYIHIPSVFISITTALIIAIIFEPLKELIDSVFEHIFEK